ncbi:MAG: hypothetical protein WBI82_07015 [Sphaerochaeta sp.]
MGFILDRGHFSKPNIQFMDSWGYDFVIMMKGMAHLVSSLITERQGTFEKDRLCSIWEYHVYGTTVRHQLYEGDTSDRYFHLFHSISKEHAERDALEVKIAHMSALLKRNEGEVVSFSKAYAEYFDLYYNEDGKRFLFAKEKAAFIEREISLCAALKELDKIEMVKQSDGVYRLDHAVTATQKAILKAFDVDVRAKAK